MSAASVSQSSSDTDYDNSKWIIILAFVLFVPVVMLVFAIFRWLFTLPWGLKAADKAFVSTPSLFVGFGSGTSGSDGGGGGSSDFSGGGGSFGGGGASGSW